MTTPSVQSVVEISSALDSLLATLYRKSAGDAFGLSREQFGAILQEIGAKYSGAGGPELHTLFATLKVEDLALARACALGNEKAWEVFLARFRVKLYDMAGNIARESSAARDLADSLYADLYGTNSRDGQRASKLASYTGRGSIEGWLRTVMAQEYINRYRQQRRLVSLEEKEEGGKQFVAPDPEPVAQVDPKLQTATDKALAALTVEDRFLLASYYLDGRTLAEIARLLRVHESTVSRKLDKLAKTLRKQIVADLTSQGMSRRQADEALEIDVRDLQINIRQHLLQNIEDRTFSKRRAEPGESAIESETKKEAGEPTA
jgi:RNA polymerase sigma-70 factor (ECF subfamily)